MKFTFVFLIAIASSVFAQHIAVDLHRRTDTPAPTSDPWALPSAHAIEWSADHKAMLYAFIQGIRSSDALTWSKHEDPALNELKRQKVQDREQYQELKKRVQKESDGERHVEDICNTGRQMLGLKQIN